ncbi:hypothetical protein [Bdellovibrio bacteriovorus]|uniref:Uncharacterized protein n=1 Tax=Bdellovibrio bacteriovorus TaxID=959 RepID=A0A150WVG5_BDEBC|nr:hypothetical protein [Bdellovibrio bacteriovorus]KYG68614.1 hypothetical protein AZI87_05090 [Bdellovibrio bacteriovorus]KYG70537.1 hypothetical protein AZI85_00920 [Bdellovibrio bacteriovorus]
MGDDSSRSIVKALKNEWSLFWEAFQGEETPSDDSFKTGKLEVLTSEQIHEMTKALVEDRKKLNQKMETVSKEIDLNSAKLESLRLVGAEDSDTIARINELTDLGQSMTTALTKLDQQLRVIREQQDRLQDDLITS